MAISTMVCPSTGRLSWPDQTARQRLKNSLRFAGDDVAGNAEESGCNEMTPDRQAGCPSIWRALWLTVIGLVMSACSLSDERSARPAALNRIAPSEGFLALARANHPASIETPRAPAPMVDLPKPLRAKIIVPETPQQCVPYARRLSGIQIHGDAWTWWDQAEGVYPRDPLPREGAVMVLKRKKKKGSLGHIAYVDEVIDDRMIIVSHANWLNQGRLHNQTPVLDVSAANDWSEIRVWNTPGGHFGGHVYHPYGFIYPKDQQVATR